MNKLNVIFTLFLFLCVSGYSQTFTIGSHRDEVLRIQGTPKSIHTYNASGYEQFSYGNSTVDISLSTQRVIEWSNFDNNLKVKLTPGNNTTTNNFYTIGSHRDEVLRIQGTPKSINTYNASGYEQLSYGNSTVDISLSTQKVIEWSNFDNNLKVKLTPGNNTTANNFYTIGSHRDEVLRIQGTPKSINIYKASGYEQFSYGNSTVDISLSTQRVIEWSNFSNNLKVKLGAEAEAALTQSNSNNENNSDEPVKKIENKSVPNNTQIKTNQQVKSNTSVTDKKLTYKEFAEKFKVKYPQYKEVDDYTLALKIIEKYPQYKSWVEMNQQKMAEEQNKYPEWLKEYYDKFPRAEENGNPKTENEQVKQTVAQQKKKSKSTQPNLYIALAIFGFFFLLALIPSFQKMLKRKTSSLKIKQMKKYFYSDGKEKNGPFSFEELKNEEINPNTLIWFEGLEEWTSAKYIKEMEEILILSPPSLEKISSEQSTSIPPPLPISQSIEKEKELVNQLETKNNSNITIKKEKKKIDKTLATILAVMACVVVYFVWFALWYIIANAVFGWRNINEGGALIMVAFFATLVLLWKFTWKKIRGLS